MRAATVSLTVNYTGAGRGTDLVADAVCVKRGKDLAFSEIRVVGPRGSRHRHGHAGVPDRPLTRRVPGRHGRPRTGAQRRIHREASLHAPCNDTYGAAR